MLWKESKWERFGKKGMKLQLVRVSFTEIVCESAALFVGSDSGAYISENTTNYYLPHWVYLRWKSGQNTMKDWSGLKIKAISALNPLLNPYIDSLFGLIYDF